VSPIVATAERFLNGDSVEFSFNRLLGLKSVSDFYRHFVVTLMQYAYGGSVG